MQLQYICFLQYRELLQYQCYNYEGNLSTQKFFNRNYKLNFFNLPILNVPPFIQPSFSNKYFSLPLTAPHPLSLTKSSGYESLIKEYAIFICKVIQLDTSEYILMSQSQMELGVFTLTWQKDKWIKKYINCTFLCQEKRLEFIR